MSHRAYVSVAFVFLFSLTGCQLTQSSKVYANSSLVVNDSAQSVPVHFIRSGGLWGAWVAVRVSLNGESLLEMRSESYASLSIRPGNYTLKVHSPSGKHFSENVSFSANTTYYILLLPGFYAPNVYSQHIRFKFIKRVHALELMEEFQMIPTE